MNERGLFSQEKKRVQSEFLAQNPYYFIVDNSTD